MLKLPTILSIETSLDDTCAAVTIGERVISNIISSQTRYHADWGGTVPDIAKRLHEKWLPRVVDTALRKAGKPDLDAVAVTYGPGLAPSLEMGIEFAKDYAHTHNLPLIAVNHMEGHLLSSFAKTRTGTKGLNDPKFPALGFLISGGHTQLIEVNAIGDYKLLGETLDDAAGEAYDKVGRMLGLGYPGGPLLAELAKLGDPIYDLKEPMTSRRDLNFSFSGLKTKVRYYLRDNNPKLTKKFLEDFSASFQEAVFKHLERRFRRAIEQFSPKMILLGGGVVSNVELRNRTRKIAKSYNLITHIPYTKNLFTDNAAMIGVSAYYQFLKSDFVKDIQALDRNPNLSFPK